MATRRGEKISKSILLLLDQAVEEAVELSSLTYRVSKFSRHLFAEAKKFARAQVKRALIHLEKTGLITFREDEEGKKYAALTEKGREKAKAYKIDILVARKPRHWDGKWRMVIFDIPEGRRKERDAVRHKLKDLDFFKLQDSVWIYPYDCRHAVAYLADYYKIREHIHLAIVDVFDLEEEARKYYGIHEGALPYEAEQQEVSLDFEPREERFIK